jgi:hypothetical protein
MDFRSSSFEARSVTHCPLPLPTRRPTVFPWICLPRHVATSTRLRVDLTRWPMQCFSRVAAVVFRLFYCFSFIFFVIMLGFFFFFFFFFLGLMGLSLLMLTWLDPVAEIFFYSVFIATCWCLHPGALFSPCSVVFPVLL